MGRILALLGGAERGGVFRVLSGFERGLALLEIGFAIDPHSERGFRAIQKI